MHKPSHAATTAIALCAFATPLTAQVFVEAERSSLPVEAAELKKLWIHDINGDGIPDIIAANGSIDVPFSPMSVLTGTGDGRWFVSDRLLNYVVGVADFDSDGDQDLLTTYGIHENDGFGGLVAQPYLNLGNVDRTAIADFTGDGLPDIVTLPECKFWRNLGSLNFVDETATRMPGQLADVAASVMDANNDGQLDLILVGANSVDLLLNQNGIMQHASAGLPATATGGFCVATIDIDGDQDDDLIIGHSANPTLLLRSVGNGTYTDVSALLGPAVSDVWSIASGDLNGDGVEDIVLGERTGGRFLRQQGGAFVHVPAAFDARGRCTTALAMADMDGDGDQDLVQGCSASNGPHPPALNASNYKGLEPKVLWNDGTGVLHDATRHDIPARENEAFADVGDINGDGFPDIVLASGNGSVMLNNGDATFANSTQNFPATGRPLLGDLDGDGDLDCVLLEWTGVFWTLRNNGSGTFAAWQGPFLAAVPANYRATDGELADFDGDNMLDLFVATGADFDPIGPGVAPDGLWRGQSNGMFVDSSSWLAAPTNLAGADVGDVDGDGDMDVFGMAYVHINENTFFSMRTFNYIPLGAGNPALADLDNDGDLDAVIGTRCAPFCGGTWNDPASSIAINDGAGNFVQTAWQQTAYQGTWSVAVADMDNDGDQDVIFGNGQHDSHRDVVAINHGGGAWSMIHAAFATDVEDTRQVLVADFDRDDDIDWLAINRSQDATGSARSKIFLNYSRQLTAPNPPRLGNDYYLRMHGSPSGAALWISLQPANTPLAPHGILGLGAVGLDSLGFLPGNGGVTTEMMIALPTASALAGITLYVQAIDVASLRLSNRLSETLVAW